MNVPPPREAQPAHASTIPEGDAYSFAGMSTRGQLMDALADMMGPHGAPGGWCLLLVGIDHLGRMNDSFGFEVADQVVAEIARRVSVRTGTPDIIARFSGSKFAILAPCPDAPGHAEMLAGQIGCAIRSTPVETSAGPMPVNVTIGGVLAPPRGTQSEVIANVQEAYDLAKRHGRGSFHLFERDPALEQRRRTNQKTAEEIVRAIWEGRVSLALQPVVDMRSRLPVFHEALARISPVPGASLKDAGQIVEAAERLGLMGLLDRHILVLATQALHRDADLRLSVNVSPSSIADREWLHLFAGEVTSEIGPRLILEMTESAAVHDLAMVRAFVSEARARGARVAIDDFGAGSTSFRNLRSLGVDMVKIDGSFVVNMRTSADDRAFVRALIQLARQLGLTTVAEWVLDEPTAQELAEAGCDYIQGELTGLATPYEMPGEARKGAGQPTPCPGSPQASPA
ncbi:GGDEF domain-containing protein [Aquabacter sp. CN5-332]|uniref:GGDEF domain-containing protein n=1 Tax=Aquabacter sp. CN5-332 TaxID=3156608 RepID=UPI0032B460F5